MRGRVQNWAGEKKMAMQETGHTELPNDGYELSILLSTTVKPEHHTDA